MRKPTHADAELLLHLYEIRREPELRKARQWFLTDFHPTGWDEIQARYLTHTQEDRYFRMTTAYWEMVGALVNRGLLHPELFFDHTGEDIATWDRCLSWIEGARAGLRPTYLCHFEQMVKDHKAYRERLNAAARRAAAGAPAGRQRPAAPHARRGRRP